MILFIWSPSTFPHFANDRSHKKTFLLIKHINDKEKIGNYLNLPSPLFSLCHFNSFLELLLSIIIPQTAVWERSLDQITFDQRSCFQLDRNLKKKLFFTFQRQGEFRPEVYSVKELLPGRLSKSGPSILHRTHHRVAPSSEETDQVLLNQRRHQFLMAYSYKTI